MVTPGNEGWRGPRLGRVWTCCLTQLVANCLEGRAPRIPSITERAGRKIRDSWNSSLHPVRPFGALALAVFLIMMLGTGCASSGSANAKSAVQSLHLFSVPVAVNLDDAPGPDGFAVRLFAKGAKGSKGIAIPNGTLEIVMFDGIVPEKSSPAPLRTWSFSGSELKKHSGQSAVGTGYRFTLRWADSPPTQSRISVLARYVPPSGPAISSAPSSVTTGVK